MHKGVLVPAFALALTSAGQALAASPFDGVWHTDPSTLRATVTPISLELHGGVFTCHSCRPPYSLEADGGFHPVSGQAGTDSASVTTADAGHMMKTNRYKGRVTLRETFAVAPDGRSAQLDLVDTGPAGTPPKTTRQVLTRTAAGPDGAGGVSGVWQLGPTAARLASMAETLLVTGTVLTMTTPDGRSSSISLDGRPTPVAGNADVDAISLHPLSDRELVETDFLGGRPALIAHLVVAPDGREMRVEIKDLLHGTTTTEIARRE